MVEPLVDPVSSMEGNGRSETGGSPAQGPSLSSAPRPLTSRKLALQDALRFRSLGAAPGRHPADPFDAITENRRGEFPPVVPTSMASWTISKWKTHLNFKPVIFPTEAALEEWFSDAGRKIVANGATANVTLSVMELDAPQDLRFVLMYARDRINEVVHVEDLADLLALELFVGTQEVEAMEKELWEPSRVRTVREAYYGFNETDLAYHFMCSRRLRYNVLGD